MRRLHALAAPFRPGFRFSNWADACPDSLHEVPAASMAIAVRVARVALPICGTRATLSTSRNPGLNFGRLRTHRGPPRRCAVPERRTSAASSMIPAARGVDALPRSASSGQALSADKMWDPANTACEADESDSLRSSPCSRASRPAAFRPPSARACGYGRGRASRTLRAPRDGLADPAHA